MTINPIRTGIVLGAVIGLYHAAWSALVALGLAQRLIDLILYLHFIKLSIEIEPFDVVRAATLVAVTFVVGFVFGVVIAWVWNMLHPRAAA